MELIQSFALTISKMPLSLYEARILVKIVEYGQAKIKGLYINKDLDKFKTGNKDVQVTIPLAHILGDSAGHYEQGVEAATRMAGRVIEYYDPDTKEFHASALISHITWHKHRGMLSFKVYGRFFDCLYNFTAGFSRYDLETAMCYKRATTLRLYMLLNGQHRPQTYSVNNLKEWLGCGDKYGHTSDFIKRVLRPAAEEMEQGGSMRLSMKTNTEGSTIKSITFTPTYIEGVNKNVSTMRATLHEITDKDVLIELVNKGDFTYRELYAHKDLLKRISQRPDAFEVVLHICHHARKGNKGKGWIINALRAEAR